MRALVVHPGTQHSFRLAAELHRLNALAGLHTGFAFVSGGPIDRLSRCLPISVQRRSANRRIAEVPAGLVHLQPLREWLALTRVSQGEDEESVLHWRNEHFQRNISGSALTAADVVIGFDTSSWILARRCRELRKPLVMVQTIGHPDSKRAIHQEITVRFPEWQQTDEPRLPKVRSAEQEELEGATLIIASSTFTRKTLTDNGVSESKIRVLPHGVDCNRFSAAPRATSRPFRFVFVGSIDARKGVPLLLEAWRKLRPEKAELWLVGPASAKVQTLLPKLSGLKYLGAVPNLEVPLIMQQCDVFVFPSYFEGFGLVILQAMACGLPVITTTATAGPDLFRDGEAGWIIPPGDEEQLLRTMSHCLTHPGEMPVTGKRARAIAEQFNWQVYGKRWLQILNEVVGEKRMEIGEPPRAPRPAPRAHRPPPTASRPAPCVLLAHPGTQYSAHLARQLERIGALGEFRTSFAFSEQGRLVRATECLPARWRHKLANRRLSGVPPNRLRTRPLQEFVALAALRCGANEQNVFYRRNASFQRSIPDAALQRADVVIGFDTSSWILAQRARALGRAFILDQSIGHPRSLANLPARLNQQYPEWPQTIPPKTEADFAREDEEHSYSSRITVPSRFVARTLEQNGVDAAKIYVNPFGVDLQRFQPALAAPPPAPLRFVFAGSLMRRKGVPLLLDVWNKLPLNHRAELVVVGSGEMPASARHDLPASVRFLGRLPQPELSRVFQQSHVFVFPSYFEGLAQVQIEAAASGLPVIGTDSSGCEEIVRNGETGFVLPTGDPDALRDALLKFIASPELALTMRERLIVERSKWSWDAYGDRWLTLLQEVSGVGGKKKFTTDFTDNTDRCAEKS